MWQLHKPKPVKLILGILAANEDCLNLAVDLVRRKIGKLDFISDTWPFDQTDYYEKQTGKNILRQFISIERLIHPDRLAPIKLKTNKLEARLAARANLDLPRPVNLDPGIIEPSKLILATTKNYAHRIYIGKNIYAEVTLIYHKDTWQSFEYTYSDYQKQCYARFFDKVRNRLLEQLKSRH